MNKRALLIALVVAAFAALLMILYVRRFEEQASGGEKVELLSLRKALQRGEAITEESLSSQLVPITYVQDRSVKAAEKSKILGLRVGNNVEPQQILMWTDLAIASDERRDLSSLIQPGNRAVSIQASRGDKSFSMIRPGDYVDVLSTLDGKNESRTAVVVLQRVLVLAVGLETVAEVLSDKGDKPDLRSREMILTLSVSLQQGQLISLAAEKGTLTVALRNPKDQRVSEDIPDMPSSALMEPQIRTNVSKKEGPAKVQ